MLTSYTLCPRRGLYGEKMRGFLCCLLFSLLVALVWPRPADNDKEDHQHHMHNGSDMPHPTHGKEDESCQTLVSRNVDFAFALYKRLAAKAAAESKNVFFAPLGISTALSLLAAGAKGDTHQQLYQALRYGNLTAAKVNKDYEHLFHALGHSQAELALDKGSAVVLQETFKPLQKFLDDAKHYYQAEGFTVNFTKPEEAVKAINKYVAEKTHSKIPDLLDSLDQDTIMVLLDYIYFRGKWEKPFEEKNTVKADFHVDENTTVSVDMMKRMGRYSYYYDRENHTTVLMLPYKGNTTMMVLLPCEGKMDNLESILSKEQITCWWQKLYKTGVDLEMPKFSVSGSYSLKEHLVDMGVVAAFSDTADLSGISEDVGLKVSKVSHKAVISVDEKGTEAAAATAVEMMPTSMPDTVSLNRPFLLFILDDSTMSLLFMGKIVNPTAH